MMNYAQVRDAESRQAWLESAGLVVVEAVWPGVGPRAQEAWSRSVLAGTLPVERVSDEPGGFDAVRVQAAWERHARQARVIGPEGNFLISVPTPVLLLDWAEVRIGDAPRMVDVLVEFPGNPDFVTMSLNGAHVCAVSSEEDETWIQVFDLD